MIKLSHPEYNFVLAIDSDYSKELVEVLNNTGLPYYINKVITKIDQFHGLLHTNVTDILIGEDLCFHLAEIKEPAEKYNKKLRTFVNVAQTSWTDKDLSIKDFFIRPDDIDFYSQYFDVFEFWEDKDRTNVLYEIYAKDKYWYGNLEDLIKGYKGHTLNANLLPDFAKRRSNCGKRCMYGKFCEWCLRMNHLS